MTINILRYSLFGIAGGQETFDYVEIKQELTVGEKKLPNFLKY